MAVVAIAKEIEARLVILCSLFVYLSCIMTLQRLTRVFDRYQFKLRVVLGQPLDLQMAASIVRGLLLGARFVGPVAGLNTPPKTEKSIITIAIRM